MEYELGLKEEFYNYILNGTKRIEIRLNDEKRRLIKLGDTIIFKKEPDRKEYFRAKVVGLLKYNNFIEMFNDFDISVLASNTYTKERLLDTLEEFYTKDKQNKYGVLGIMIELL